MKKIKYLIACFLGAFILVLAAGCSDDTKISKLETEISDLENKNQDLEKKNASLESENKTLKEENEALKARLTYQVLVYDIDSSLLGDKKILVDEYDTLYEGLCANFEVVATSSSYGHYIESINGSVVDPNYYVAFYKNGELSSVGVDSATFKIGDVFEFRVECWNTLSSGYGTLDETDLLIDQIIYKYGKKYFDLSKETTFTGSSYWSFMTINALNSNPSYKNHGFNTSSLTDAYKESLKVDNITSAAEYGKYYYAAKALNLDLTSYAIKYRQYLESSDFTSSYVAYTTPFVIGANKTLGLNNEKITTMIDAGLNASTEWGIDDFAWQTSVYSLYKDYTKDDLTTLEVKDYENGTSTALAIMAYSCAGINVRSIENSDSLDLIEILINNYYDETTSLVCYNKADAKIDYSTNQIYASLVAYKLCRDTKNKVALFA